ncbi:MAG TPA: OmpA family protein [Burkholderiaceae bacterium]|nr:OmpA family protein [Burkholderiaceae bacterium]
MKATVLLFSAAMLVSGCAVLQQEVPLASARLYYDSVRTEAGLTAEARSELARAGNALAAAEEARERGEAPPVVARLANLSKQRSMLAWQHVQLARAERRAQAVAVAAAPVDSSRSETPRPAAGEKRPHENDTPAAAGGIDDATRASASPDDFRTAFREAVKAPPGSQVVTLGDGFFDVGREYLNPGAARSLDPLAEFLRAHPQRRVRIEGFTDSTGTVETNLQLSLARANEVRDALVRRGVAANRIQTVGHGPAAPIASNATAAGRRMNRRIEVVISDEGGNLLSSPRASTASQKAPVESVAKGG